MNFLTDLNAANRQQEVKQALELQNRKVGRNDPCWCGCGRKYKQCHMAFDEKLEQHRRRGDVVPLRTMIKTPAQIAKIKESAAINIAVLDYVAEHIKEGVTTAEIDRWVQEETTKCGGIAAPLGYGGFPKSVCTSVNEVVCHGIPSEEVVLKNGDIINVDVSTNYQGYYSDASRMFCIGEVSAEKKRLVEKARECLEEGLKQVKPWGYLGDMGQAVNDCAQANGYSIVREIGGHAIGLEFHEDPWVSYVSKRGTEMVMAPGLMFTIEPMVNMGSHEIYVDDTDKWTVYTEDGLPSAQWEVQVLVTETGYEIIAY